jgi:3-oxoacyl-(acyl-carrier-protein) synthase
MNRGVYVVGSGALSAVAPSVKAARAAYARGVCSIAPRRIGDQVHHVGTLCPSGEEKLTELAATRPASKNLDRTVCLGLLAARAAIASSDFSERASPVGVIVASSRGATESLEHHHSEFLSTGRTGVFSSPTTTLGSLASSIAHELASRGIAETISSACTSSLHALLLGVAWLRAGLGDACLVGGAEAPLTPFTLAQFSALGLIRQDDGGEPACRPLALQSLNQLVLGEGACVLGLESLSRRGAELRGALAEVSGIGTCVEKARSMSGITKEGDALTNAMGRALADHGEQVDAVVVHAPGTKNGDAAELAALRRVFGTNLPALCSSKWQMGHTFGAAGALGVEFALALLSGVRPAEPPYASALRAPAGDVRSVMVNAAGFGGSAVSVVLRRLH